MKLRATLQVSITIKEDDLPEEAQERVINKLVDTCEDWLNGDSTPTIRLQYTLDDDYLRIDKSHLN